jgi:hypothetical protein
MGLNDFFFGAGELDDSAVFDEGPVIIRTINRFTKSIDTTAIDAFRQGVEITNTKFYDAGIVKIHAGEPGHVLTRTTVGENSAHQHDATFNDKYDVEPKSLLAQVSGSVHYSKRPHTCNTVVNLPSSYYDNYIRDGVIDATGVHSRKNEIGALDADNARSSAIIQDGNEITFNTSDRIGALYPVDAGITTTFVESTPALPGWHTLYQLDLTAEPNQDLTLNGSFTMGGKTWWAKGLIPYPSGSYRKYELVNGKGLRLSASADSLSGLEIWNPTSGFYLNSYNDRVFFLPFENVNVDPSRPVFVTAKFSSPRTLPIPAGSLDDSFWFGFIDCARNSSNVTSQERATYISAYQFNDTSVEYRKITWPSTTVASYVALFAPGGNNLYQDFCHGMKYETGSFSAYATVDTGSVTDITLFQTNVDLGLPLTPGTQGYGFYITLNVAASTVGSKGADVYLTNLTVQQYYSDDSIRYNSYSLSKLFSSDVVFRDLHRNVYTFSTAQVRDDAMSSAIADMEPSNESYVPPLQRSLSTGFTYDASLTGADSLAFGGLSYPRQ